MSDGKIAIVTGGSRGIGRNTVLCLAKRGVRSIFTFNTNRAEADKVVALAAKTIALQLDTGNVGSFDGFLGQVRDALAEMKAERFDYLVNNAGISSAASLQSITEAEMDALYNVHFKGVLFLTQKLLPLMNDGGRIVNISSGLARFAMPNRIGYGPIKAAVEALTRYMAVELGPRRIAATSWRRAPSPPISAAASFATIHRSTRRSPIIRRSVAPVCPTMLGR